MTMADKIVVRNAGRIEQVGAPVELYNAPVSPFVAGFIGSPKMNLYDGKAVGEACATYGIRPEHLRLTDVAPRWTGTVRNLERLRADTMVYLMETPSRRSARPTGPALFRNVSSVSVSG
jgi:multiple sugar transport system ATP-binding protein